MTDTKNPGDTLTVTPTKTLSLKRPSNAQPLLRRAIALDPASAPSYANLAAVTLALGDSAGAELLARRALALAPRNAGAQRVLEALRP